MLIYQFNDDELFFFLDPMQEKWNSSITRLSSFVNVVGRWEWSSGDGSVQMKQQKLNHAEEQRFCFLFSPADRSNEKSKIPPPG